MVKIFTLFIIMKRISTMLQKIQLTLVLKVNSSVYIAESRQRYQITFNNCSTCQIMFKSKLSTFWGWEVQT